MMMIKKEVWCMEIDDMYDKSWRQITSIIILIHYLKSGKNY